MVIIVSQCDGENREEMCLWGVLTVGETVALLAGPMPTSFPVSSSTSSSSSSSSFSSFSSPSGPMPTSSPVYLSLFSGLDGERYFEAYLRAYIFRPRCQQGSCVAPDSCKCHTGFGGRDCSKCESSLLFELLKLTD